MHYRLELILGEDVDPQTFGMFLEAVDEGLPYRRSHTSGHQMGTWAQETRAARATAWIRKYDAAAWADEGTLLLLALITLAK